MEVKINKQAIINEANLYLTYEKQVQKEAASRGFGQQENRTGPESEVDKMVKKSDVDDSHPDTEYFNTIYDSDELKDIERVREKITNKPKDNNKS